MASFKILRTDDPAQYRDRILRLWEENLPGTPQKRLDWLKEGNPAGPSVWFLAIEEDTSEVAGTITIMPRRIYCRGEEYFAGVLGDFMVDPKHRVFGPNLMLMRAALKSSEDLGLSFMYTVPNESSRKVAEYAGVRYVMQLDCYARPLDLKFYIEKRLPSPLAAVFAPVVGFLLRLSSMETRLSFDGTVEETVDIGDDFDSFWERLREGTKSIIGERSAAYLRWRYKSNPLYRFRFLVSRRKGEREISGYAVFCTHDENKIDIYDIQASDGGCFDGLVRTLIDVGRADRSQALYFAAPRGSTKFDKLRRFRFFDTKGTIELGISGEPDLSFEKWDFVSGDRNI